MHQAAAKVTSARHNAAKEVQMEDNGETNPGLARRSQRREAGTDKDLDTPRVEKGRIRAERKR